MAPSVVTKHVTVNWAARIHAVAAAGAPAPAPAPALAPALAPAPTAGPGSPKLNANQQLTSGQFLLSPNGNYKLIYQADGNLVLYASNTVLWSSQTFGKSCGKAILQDDGNFVVYDASGAAVWGANSEGGKYGSYANSTIRIGDDGSLILLPQ